MFVYQSLPRIPGFYGQLLHKYFIAWTFVYFLIYCASVRPHGYSQKGSRCYGTHDWHAKGRINVIGAIIDFTYLTLSLFESKIHSDVVYLE